MKSFTAEAEAHGTSGGRAMGESAEKQRLFAAMREDEEMRAGPATGIARLRRDYDLSPAEELPFDATGSAEKEAR